MLLRGAAGRGVSWRGVLTNLGRGVGVTLCALLVLVPALVAADLVRVRPLHRDGQIFVSFELTDAFSEEMRAAIRSGLPTTFSYDVELRRAIRFWFDSTVASTTVAASVQYDNLTRRYHLSRTQDGRVDTSEVVDNEETARDTMTTFDRLPLFSATPLEANSEFYLHVDVRTRPHNGWFAWPWSRATASGSAKFTFIP